MLVLEIATQGVRGLAPAGGRFALKAGYNVVAADGPTLRRLVEAMLHPDPADGEFRKTAAIMKMVISGYAAAGTITMGGYDYHTGNRADGETRNFRAGRCVLRPSTGSFSTALGQRRTES